MASLHLLAAVLLSACYSINTCFGQNRTDAPTATPRDIVPPAPDAAALGRYGETPVSLYKGTPTISIPIYTLAVKDFSLPIQLSYNASGIKVDEVASTVGLGWSLEAGGVITSVMHGRPDLRGSNTRSMPADLRAFNPSYATNKKEYEFARSVIDEQADTEPDVFLYNFAGRAGKFLFSADRSQVSLIPYQPLQVHYNDATAGPGTFTIIDEKGVRYDFRHVEFTSSRRECDRFVNPRDDVPNFAASWYLSKVTTSLGVEIVFSYDRVFYRYAQSQSETVYKPSTAPVAGCADMSGQNLKCTTQQRISGQRLTAITSSADDTRIEFRYSSAKREDLLQSDTTGNNALTSIRVKHGTQPVQEHQLSYNYFRSQGYSAALPEAERVLYSRLKLEAIRRVGQPAHAFGYYSAHELPRRLSYAQDHWGYYNGQTANLSLIPRSSQLSLSGDRGPAEGYALANILSTIAYPTGGQTRFEYESNHQYGHENRVSYKSHGFRVSVDSGNVSANKTFTVSTLQDQQDHLLKWYVPPVTNGERSTVSLIYPDGRARFFAGASPVNGERMMLPPGTYTMRVIDRFEAGAFLSYNWVVPASYRTYTKSIGRGIRVSRIVDVPEGGQPPVERKYRYPNDTPEPGATLEPAAPPADNLGVDLQVPKYDPSQHTVSYCRYRLFSSAVERLLADEDTGVSYAKVVVYEGTNGSNGRTIHQFTTGMKDFAGQAGQISDGFDGWAQGLPLVTTHQRFDSQSNRFVSVKREVRSYFAHHQAGAYWNNDTSQQRYNERWVPAYRLKYLHPQYQGDDFMIYPAEFILETYVYNSVWFYERERQEMLYHFRDSTQFSTTRTRFQYQNPLHAQLTRQVQYLEDGHSRVNATQYPLDFDTTGAVDPSAQAIRLLARRHLLTSVVSQQNWLRTGAQTKFVGGQVSHYANLLPSRSYLWAFPTPADSVNYVAPAIRSGVFTQDARYRLSSTTERYNPLGYVEQHRVEHKLPTSYLWGYSSAYPIAQVDAAAWEQIACTSFEPTSRGRWYYDSLRVVNGGRTGQWAYQLTGLPIRSLPIVNAIATAYQISCWATAPPVVALDGAPQSAVLEPVTPADPRGFRLYKCKLTLPSGTAIVSLTAGNTPLLLDEVRLHPSVAQVTTFTHAPLVGLTSQTDPAGRTTTYEYDALGRLLRTRDEQGRVLTQQQYHYARP